MYYLFIILFIIIIIFIIKNKNNKTIESFETIPKIIIQTWKDNNIPKRYEKLILSLKKHNPNYKYMFFSDNDIEEFLKTHYPKYYETFLKLPVIIQKIDFFRYIAIYHYGGFYFDLDIECYKNFDDLLNYECIFGIDTYINKYLMCNIERFKYFCKNPYLVGQYAFGAKPKNAFIKLLIDNIHNNIDIIGEKYYKLNDKKNLNYVYDTTGPDYVSKIYYNYNYSDKITILDNGKKQYFGDYARHKFMGTWKKRLY